MYSNLRALAKRHPIILASGSPRRQQLLSEVEIPFEQLVPRVTEQIRPDEEPFDYARRLAEEKAREVISRAKNGAVAVGCDTIVLLGSRLLEKPANEQDAFEILSLLSGREHFVCSGLALANSNAPTLSGHEVTTVRFHKTSPDDLRRYITTGEPMDKAGAYGLQGKGAFLVDSIEGNLDTVIGLPRMLLDRLAGEWLSRL